jgi:hypothetical protein
LVDILKVIAIKVIPKTDNKHLFFFFFKIDPKKLAPLSKDYFRDEDHRGDEIQRIRDLKRIK